MPLAQATTPPPSTQVSNMQDEVQKADLLNTYHKLTTSTPPYPPSLAAMLALTTTLSNTPQPPTTTSETLALITHLTAHLRCSVENPIPLTAGTDLLQRFLLATLNNPITDSTFTSTLHRALETTALLVERGLQLPSSIARTHHTQLVLPHATILTYTYAPSVEAVLLAAARAQTPFRVVSVLPPASPSSPAATLTRHSAKLLRSMGVPVALVACSGAAKALAMALPEDKPQQDEGDDESRRRRRNGPVYEHRVSTVLLGADAVLANGGVMGPLGTLQVATLAGQTAPERGRRVDVFVAAETFRFVRVLPLGQGEGEGELGGVGVGFQFEDGGGATTTTAPATTAPGDGGDEVGEEAEAFDITPPGLITAIVTESGLLPPSAVCEEMIKTWF